MLGFPLAPVVGVLVLGRAEGCSEGWGARWQEDPLAHSLSPVPDMHKVHLLGQDNS